MANKMQVKRGNKVNLPALSDGEFGFCKDTNELYIGNGGTNVPLNSGFVFEAAASNIKMNGAQSAGSLATVARGDHVHPTDTTRAPVASPALTGTPTAPTAAAGANTTQLATTAFVAAAVGSATVSEAGANYIKYSNGTMIEWGSRTFTPVNIGAAWGSLYTSGDLSMDDFSQAFVSVPIVSVNVNRTGGSVFFVCKGSPATKTNPGTYQVCSATGGAGASELYMDYTAVGRWKA